MIYVGPEDWVSRVVVDDEDEVVVRCTMVGALETRELLASDLAADLKDATLSGGLTELTLDGALETTEREPSSSRARVGPLASDIGPLTSDLGAAGGSSPGRYTASMLLPSKSITAAL